MSRLADKSAVVTGAANGIGRAIARRFATEGARLVLVDIQAQALDQVVAEIAAAGGTAHSVVGNVTEEAPAIQAVQTAIDRFGGLDILVNNVGGGRNGRIWEISPADWDHVIRLNLRSVFMCTRAAAPHMIGRGAGRIICMSSGAREGTPWSALDSGAAAYSAAKAGVHGFIRDMALELGPHNVCINAVAPGPVRTEAAVGHLEELNRRFEYSPNKMTPLRRMAEPEEIANAVLFLASDEASYITGVTLHVAGGR
jgi:NAD(P)-dependent dehydrogenase (short-subunit alcohol dehydrogenase family)